MNEFVAIDFETATQASESAISIGLVKFRDFKAVDSYYSLIRPPELYIRPDFTQIHGLTIDDVQDAPPFPDMWENVRRFIGALPLAAHHAPFDMGVLRALFLHYAIAIPELRYFCTCVLSRRVWPELHSHALTALARHFDIVYKAHNALDDAETCGKLVQLAAEQFASENLAELLAAAKVKMSGIAPAEPNTMPREKT